MRTRTLSTLAALAAASALTLTACGDDDDAGAGKPAPAASTPAVDASALLREGMLNFSPGGKPISSGSFRLVVSGKLVAPEDPELREVSGKVTLDAAIDKGAAEATLPPFTIHATASGRTKQPGKKKRTAAKYDVGLGYVNDRFYARWDGKDYDAGTEISGRILSEYRKQTRRSESQGERSPSPARLLEAMKLEPARWMIDPVAVDGPTFDGEPTFKITGEVDERVLAEDVAEGLQALPSELPKGAGLESLRELRDLSVRDYREIETAIKKINVTVWIGKSDKLQRRLLVDLDVHDDDPDGPVRLSARFDLATTKLGEPQRLAAPPNTAPLTDLLLKLPGGTIPGLGGEAPAATTPLAEPATTP